MRLIKVSLAGLVLAGILAVVPTAAFARGGGGHGGGGGGHAGGGGHFARGSGGHRSATDVGAHFAAHGWHGGHYGYGGGYWGGGPFWGWDGDPYPYDGYNEQTVVAVQKELKKLGYYDGQTDGIPGPETRKAVGWFQSVDKLSVTGRIDNPTLKALQIS